MDEQPRKRLGRPRKTLAVPNAAAEGEDAINVHFRDGQAGEAGTTARTITEGQGKSLGWLELVAIVKERTSHEYRIACVIHPEANGIVETEHLGAIRTLIGEPGYQLNTGEIVTC